MLVSSLKLRMLEPYLRGWGCEYLYSNVLQWIYFCIKRKPPVPEGKGGTSTMWRKSLYLLLPPFYLSCGRKKCIDDKVVGDGGDASSIPIPDCSCVFPFGLLLDITLGVIQTNKSLSMMCCLTKPHRNIIFTVAWSWWETEVKWIPPIGGGVM